MKKYQSFLSENFQFLEVKFSIYLNRRVFVMEMEKLRLFVSQCLAIKGSILLKIRHYFLSKKVYLFDI